MCGHDVGVDECTQTAAVVESAILDTYGVVRDEAMCLDRDFGLSAREDRRAGGLPRAIKRPEPAGCLSEGQRMVRQIRNAVLVE